MCSKIFNYKYLNRQHLDGFDNYKYSAKDTNPLSVYVMHPFWNKVVELVPKWVAPNLLTFVGFLFTVLDFVLLSHYDYSFYASSSQTERNGTADIYSIESEGIPSWCWMSLSVFLFLAYTLDGIDGKQARRTQTSGPLGELFDHGLDSYSVFFIPVCLYSIFGRLEYSVSPLRMYFILWNLLFAFYVSHWEKYNTGVLFLPWGYDLSMWSGILVFFTTGITGHAFWKINLFGNFTAANMFEVVIYSTGLLTNVPISCYNTYISYKDGTGKMRPFLEAIRPLWSILAAFIASTLWVLNSPSDIINSDPRMVYLCIGTIFSNLCVLTDCAIFLVYSGLYFNESLEKNCRLIVSQMSNTRCAISCSLVWICAALAILGLLVPTADLLCLYMCTAISVIVHVHYGVCVVRQMCQHFKINCFSIKERSE